MSRLKEFKEDLNNYGLDWFNQKKEEFFSMEAFDEDSQMIVPNCPIYFEPYEGAKIPEEYLPRPITFSEFLIIDVDSKWFYERQVMLVNTNPFKPNLNGFLSKVRKKMYDELDGNEALIGGYVSDFLEFIEDWLLAQSSSFYTDEEKRFYYDSMYALTKSISFTFSNELESNSIWTGKVSTFTLHNKLNFNLGLGELASLFNILVESKIINVHDNTLGKFGKDNFRYKNKGTYVDASSFGNSLSEHKNDFGNRPSYNVAEQLLPAIENTITQAGK